LCVWNRFAANMRNSSGKWRRGDVEDIFRWIPYSLKTPEDFQRLIEKAFDEQSEASRWCLRLSSEVRDA